MVVVVVVVATVFLLQTDWASIGLVDMFNAGGAIASDTVVNAAVAGPVNGGEVRETAALEVMVSFANVNILGDCRICFPVVFFFFLFELRRACWWSYSQNVCLGCMHARQRRRV